MGSGAAPAPTVTAAAAAPSTVTFPSSPTLNQSFTSGTRTWVFNGTAWKLQAKTTDQITEGTTNKYYTDARVAAAPAVSALEGRASAIESAATAEEAARIAADTALGQRIDNVLSNVDPAVVDSFTEVVAEFQAADSNLNGAITSLANSASSALATETAAREAADTTLQSNIDAEAATRASADTTLQGNIDAEASTRASAISAVEASLSSEASTRASADSALTASLSSETSARQAADTALENSKQIKDVLSATAPSHVEGLVWVDTTDMSEYRSYGGVWIEIDKS